MYTVVQMLTSNEIWDLPWFMLGWYMTFTQRVVRFLSVGLGKGIEKFNTQPVG